MHRGERREMCRSRDLRLERVRKESKRERRWKSTNPSDEMKDCGGRLRDSKQQRPQTNCPKRGPVSSRKGGPSSLERYDIWGTRSKHNRSTSAPELGPKIQRTPQNTSYLLPQTQQFSTPPSQHPKTTTTPQRQPPAATPHKP